MKHIFCICILLVYTTVNAQVKMGDNPLIVNGGAILELESTNKAFLPPRLTQAQRNSIPTPVAGMTIFNTNSECLEVYRNSILKWWNFCSNSYSNAVVPTSQRLLGGNEYEEIYGMDTTVDGGSIAAGFSESSNAGTLSGITTNGGSDGWVIKSDAAGVTTWQKLLGGTNGDYLNSIQQTADGGYIAAGISESSNSGTLTGVVSNGGGSEGWIIKLDAAGNTTWQLLLGGTSSDYLNSIQQTADGGYIAAGSSASSNDGTLAGVTNNGNYDGWIIKLDAAGTVTWQLLLGGDIHDRFLGIQQTADGGYIAAGTSGSDNSGTLSGIFNNGNEDGWIIKLDAAGLTTWQKLLGGGEEDFFEGNMPVQQTADGGYIIVGESESSNSGTLTGIINNGTNADGWIVKLDAAGNTSWQKLLGGLEHDYLSSIRQTADGGYIVGGYSSSSNSGTLTGVTAQDNEGNGDGWIIKLDGAGNTTWQRLMGGTEEDEIKIVRPKGAGYIIAAYTSSSNSGSLIGLTNNGDHDCWIFFLDATGN